MRRWGFMLLMIIACNDGTTVPAPGSTPSISPVISQVVIDNALMLQYLQTTWTIVEEAHRQLSIIYRFCNERILHDSINRSVTIFLDSSSTCNQLSLDGKIRATWSGSAMQAGTIIDIYLDSLRINGHSLRGTIRALFEGIDTNKRASWVLTPLNVVVLEFDNQNRIRWEYFKMKIRYQGYATPKVFNDDFYWVEDSVQGFTREQIPFSFVTPITLEKEKNCAYFQKGKCLFYYYSDPQLPDKIEVDFSPILGQCDNKIEVRWNDQPPLSFNLP